MKVNIYAACKSMHRMWYKELFLSCQIFSLRQQKFIEIAESYEGYESYEVFEVVA